MDVYYKCAFWFCKKITGEKIMGIFTVQKALLKVLGYYWFSGGWKLPLPNIIKAWFYPVLYPSVEFIVSYLTIKAVTSMIASNDYEFTRKINGYIVSMTFIACALKSIYFRIIDKDVQKLIEMIEKIADVDIENGPIANAHRACTSYATLLLINAGSWALYYLITHFDFPFPTAYPWNQETTLGWWTAFFITFNCAFYCALIHTLVDTVFPMCVAVITYHINQIKTSLRKLGTEGKWSDQYLIIQAIQLHVKILRVNKQIKKCFGLLFVAQSVYTVLHACSLIFAVMQADETVAPLMSALPMLSAAYAQLFMYCYYGQTLTNHHESLSFALYNNCWYCCNTRLRKLIIIFGEGLKKDIYLEGFGTVQASFPTYLKVRLYSLLILFTKIPVHFTHLNTN
ncbi:hypothetical protein O3M35_008450 [Rhynocoris fuscipes]|uniref:Odorant receptor n=1 Tax=Rhynocoris fuscipes TaxID=488301 RepID=A0AAW1D8Y9_9HEMI